jgi:multimeric flavodoxin WrbA
LEKRVLDDQLKRSHWTIHHVAISQKQPMKIIAIVGTYRKGGVIDTAVDEILSSARESGAETTKIYLIDRHIEFCTNCRTCTQQEGQRWGQCAIADDMQGLLEEIDRSDAIVLASPMNFWTVTAVMKRFIERLVCFAYWPWGSHAPKTRSKRKDRLAVIVVSSAAPSLLARMMSRMVGLLKSCAGLLGAKTIGVIFIGLVSGEPKPDIGARARRKARRLGQRLAAHRASSA